MRNILIRISKYLPNPIRVRAVIVYQKIFNRIKYGDPWFPRSICLETSVHCNRRCPYCPQSVAPTPVGFMEWDVFDLALSRMKEIGWTGPVDFNFYNEPTLDKRLIEMIARVSRIGALPRVVTNGDRLDESYMDEAIGAGITFFGVTRHPPFKDEWDLKMKRLMSNPRYAAHITFGEIFGKPELLSNRAGAVEIPNFIPLTTCRAPSLGFNILHNGDVVLCCADYHKTQVMGNIKDDGILEIWENPHFAWLRKEVAEGRPPLDICSSCFGEETFASKAKKAAALLKRL